jgi:hypothetical protein
MHCMKNRSPTVHHRKENSFLEKTGKWHGRNHAQYVQYPKMTNQKIKSKGWTIEPLLPAYSPESLRHVETSIEMERFRLLFS